MAEPIAASAMTEEQLADFLDQLHLCALEEAPLWEIPQGSTDLVRGGPVVHGPWLPSDCATVLFRWFDRGLIGLYRLVPGGPQANVDASEVRRTLSRPASWADDRRHGLFVSEDGLNAGRGRWL